MNQTQFNEHIVLIVEKLAQAQLTQLKTIDTLIDKIKKLEDKKIKR